MASQLLTPTTSKGEPKVAVSIVSEPQEDVHRVDELHKSVEEWTSKVERAKEEDKQRREEWKHDLTTLRSTMATLRRELDEVVGSHLPLSRPPSASAFLDTWRHTKRDYLDKYPVLFDAQLGMRNEELVDMMHKVNNAFGPVVKCVIGVLGDSRSQSTAAAQETSNALQQHKLLSHRFLPLISGLASHYIPVVDCGDDRNMEVHPVYIALQATLAWSTRMLLEAWCISSAEIHNSFHLLSERLEKEEQPHIIRRWKAFTHSGLQSVVGDETTDLHCCANILWQGISVVLSYCGWNSDILLSSSQGSGSASFRSKLESELLELGIKVLRLNRALWSGNCRSEAKVIWLEADSLVNFQQVIPFTLTSSQSGSGLLVTPNYFNTVDSDSSQVVCTVELGLRVQEMNREPTVMKAKVIAAP